MKRNGIGEHMALTSIEKRVTTLNTTRSSSVVKRIVGRELQRIRDRVMLRDEYTCRACGRTTVDGEVDHIVPLSMGGSNSEYNLQYLCAIPCHRDKTAKEEKERDNKY